MKNETEITRTALVKYDIGTYEGTEEVECLADDDNDDIIRKAKNQLRRKIGSFPAVCIMKHGRF